MPLVRIDLIEGKPVEYRRGIGDVVYHAMIEVLKVPKDDRFQVIAAHPEHALVADQNYLGIKRSQDCVFIQITLNAGRSSRRNLFIERWRKNFIPAWDFALRTFSSASSRFPRRTGRSGTAKRNTLICESRNDNWPTDNQKHQGAALDPQIGTPDRRQNSDDLRLARDPHRSVHKRRSWAGYSIHAAKAMKPSLPP
jgi:hypothetical protein